jgi:hypothetical protein
MTNYYISFENKKMHFLRLCIRDSDKLDNGALVSHKSKKLGKLHPV